MDVYSPTCGCSGLFVTQRLSPALEAYHRRGYLQLGSTRWIQASSLCGNLSGDRFRFIPGVASTVSGGYTFGLGRYDASILATRHSGIEKCPLLQLAYSAPFTTGQCSVLAGMSSMHLDRIGERVVFSDSKNAVVHLRQDVNGIQRHPRASSLPSAVDFGMMSEASSLQGCCKRPSIRGYLSYTRCEVTRLVCHLPDSEHFQAQSCGNWVFSAAGALHSYIQPSSITEAYLSSRMSPTS